MAEQSLDSTRSLSTHIVNARQFNVMPYILDLDGLAALFCRCNGLNSLSFSDCHYFFSMFVSSVDFLSKGVYFCDCSQKYTPTTWNDSLTWKLAFTSTLFRGALIEVTPLIGAVPRIILWAALIVEPYSSPN